jgi:hypothetical protein
MAVRVEDDLQYDAVEPILSSQVAAVAPDTMLVVAQEVERTAATLAATAATAEAPDQLTAALAAPNTTVVALAINPTVASVGTTAAGAVEVGGVVVVADTTTTQAAVVQVSQPT